MDYAQFEANAGDKTLLAASKGGQFAWGDIIGRLREFDYENDGGLAIRWHVAGRDKSVIIDPKVQFGAPSVEGVATWAFKGRWEAGEDLDDIADDSRCSPSITDAEISVAAHVRSRHLESVEWGKYLIGDGGLALRMLMG